MLHVTYICEDQVILITIHDAANATIEVQDAVSGESAKITATVQSVAAALALSIGSDEMQGADELYRLAEPLMVALGKASLRFIP